MFLTLVRPERVVPLVRSSQHDFLVHFRDVLPTKAEAAPVAIPPSVLRFMQRQANTEIRASGDGRRELPRALLRHLSFTKGASADVSSREKLRRQPQPIVFHESLSPPPPLFRHRAITPTLEAAADEPATCPEEADSMVPWCHWGPKSHHTEACTAKRRKINNVA
jgi:hypothetical protein